MEELISVIIPACNAEKTIKKCLTSILDSEYRTLEIIVVVNNSKDKTYEIAEEFLKEDNRIQLYNIKTSGVSEARNYGIQVASGKYISFIDSDDYIEKSFFLVLISNLKQNNAQLSIVNYTKNGIINVTNSLYHYVSMDIYQAFFNNDITGYVWDKLYITNIVKGMKFSDEYAIGEDKMFVFEYLLKIGNVVKSDAILYHYIQVPGSTLNSGFSVKYWDLVKGAMQIETSINKNMFSVCEAAKKMCLVECIRFAIMSSAEKIFIDKEKEIIHNYIKNNRDLLSVIQVKKSWKLYGRLISINYRLYEIVFGIFRVIKRG